MPATHATTLDLDRSPKEKLRHVCYLGGPSGAGASAFRARRGDAHVGHQPAGNGAGAASAAARLRIHADQSLARRSLGQLARAARRRHRVPDPRRERGAALCQPGAVGALDGIVRVRRLRLCLDLGAAARRPGRFRHRDRHAALHSGICRPQGSRDAARIPFRQPLARARDGDRVGGARGARRAPVRRIIFIPTRSCRSTSPASACRCSRSAACRTAWRARSTGSISR